MLIVVLLGAVQMFVLGMIGEYLGRLYVESKRRPLYLVADVAGPVQGHASLGYRAEDSGEVSVSPQTARSDAAELRRLGTNGALAFGTASVRIDTPGVIGTRPTRWRSSRKMPSNNVLSGLAGGESSLSSAHQPPGDARRGGDREQQRIEIAELARPCSPAAASSASSPPSNSGVDGGSPRRARTTSIDARAP